MKQKYTTLARKIAVGLLIVQSHQVRGEADRPPTTHARLESRLKEIVKKSGLAEEKLGLTVLSSTSQEGQEVFGLNSTKPFVPASITKILTAAAALEYFPPGFQFDTQLLSDAPVAKGTLQGHLYLKGGGDPSFVSEKLWFLINEFTRNDISTITGDLVVDDTLFDSVRVDDDRDPNRVDRAYDAPVGAMSFNWNSVNVFIRPGSKVGAPAVVKVDPESPYLELKSRATTAATGGKGDIQVTRVSKNKKDLIEVAGHIGLRSPEIVVYKSITSPDLWSGWNAVEFLKQRGIKVGGTVRAGSTPGSAQILAKAPSVPISEIVLDMMKFSNNYVAEMLTKNIAAAKGIKPATMKAGLEVVREFAKFNGVKSPEFRILNASGLTMENRITPMDLARFMLAAQGKFSVFPEFLASFPIAGVDGTLKSRFRGTTDRGMVRAKTGLMKIGGVSSLAGYAGRADGEILPFVFIFNDSKGLDVDRLWRLFDSLATALARD